MQKQIENTKAKKKCTQTKATSKTKTNAKQN